MIKASVCEQTAKDCYLTLAWRGVKPATLESQVKCPNHYTTRSQSDVCTVQINLEMVHELVLGVKDVKQMLAGFLVHCVDHLVKHAVQVLHEH